MTDETETPEYQGIPMTADETELRRGLLQKTSRALNAVAGVSPFVAVSVVLDPATGMMLVHEPEALAGPPTLTLLEEVVEHLRAKYSEEPTNDD